MAMLSMKFQTAGGTNSRHGSSDFPQDPFNLRGSYGAADYDVRHSLNANYVWQLPVKTMLHGRGPDSLVKGWQVSGTIFARTGFPYTVIDFAETGNLAPNNFYGTIYPCQSPHSAGRIPVEREP